MEMVGGHRLVRRLGGGDRAEIWLGHAGSTQVTSETRTVAVKIFRPFVDRRSIAAEIEALTRASSRHLLGLEDITTMRDGRPALILPRLSSASVAALLASRGSLSAGEAVTILAPIAQAVTELHRVGIAHGSLSLASVHFDEDGAPVLCRFGAATVLGPPPQSAQGASLTPVVLAGLPAVQHDISALVVMSRALLEATPGSPARASILRLLDEFSPERAADQFCVELELRLFDFAVASPVTFSVEAVPSEALVGLIRRETELRQSERGQHRERKVTSSLRLSAVLNRAIPAVTSQITGVVHALRGLLPEWVGDLSERIRSTEPSSRAVPDSSGQIRVPKRGSEPPGKGLRRYRRPLIVAGIVGTTALVVTLIVVPSTGSSEGSQSPGGVPTLNRSHPSEPLDAPNSTGDTASNTATKDLPRRAIPDNTDTAVRSKVPTTPASSESPNTTVSNKKDLITGADPVAAVEVLLALRQTCLEEKSLPCLSAVNQPDSAAADSDVRLVNQLRAGDALIHRSPVVPTSLVLVERLGDSALLAASHPEGSDETQQAYVLLVRGATGWRIRDLVLGG